MRSDTCPLHDKLFKAVCMLFSFPLPRIKSVGSIFGCRGGSFMFRGTEETYQCWTIHLGDLHRRETFLSCCCQCTFRPLCHGRKTGTTTNCHGPGDSPVPSAHLSSSLCFISWAAGHFENKRMFVLSLLWGQPMRNTSWRLSGKGEGEWCLCSLDLLLAGLRDVSGSISFLKMKVSIRCLPLLESQLSLQIAVNVTLPSPCF